MEKSETTGRRAEFVISVSAMTGFGSRCESGIFFSPLALRIAPLRCTIETANITSTPKNAIA